MSGTRISMKVLSRRSSLDYLEDINRCAQLTQSHTAVWLGCRMLPRICLFYIATEYMMSRLVQESIPLNRDFAVNLEVVIFFSYTTTNIVWGCIEIVGKEVRRR